MRKKLACFIALLTISVGAFAQKEIYFSNIKPDSMKVESLRGLEIQLSTEPISLIQNFTSTPQRYSFPLYIGFFSENRIAPAWTLTYRGGIQNSLGFYQDFKYHFDSIKGYSNMSQIDAYKMVYYNRFVVSAGLEPRWHVGFKERAELGKGNFNSGWFLSLPLQINMPLPVYLHTATVNPILDQGVWIKDYFNVKASISPTVGFRKALSSNWFMEGSGGLNISTSYYSFKYNSYHTSYIGRIQLAPELKLKAAYIFK